MKKAITILLCIAVLCVSITTCLHLPAPMQVSAARNSSLPSILSTISVDMPLAFLGSPNSTEPQGLAPTDVKAIYNLPSTGGNGTIAIIDPYDVPTIKNDLQAFSARFNLPFNESQFRKVTVDVPQGQTISSNINATVETVMDVEWAHAIAPNASILLVEAYNDSLGYLLDGVLYAESQQDAISISMSWGINETFLEQVLESNGFTESDLDPYYFTDSYIASFFAASGDTATPMFYPACSPNVVAVGGTTLNLYSNGSLSSETVWNNIYGTTGGGISAFETEPSCQASYGVPNSNGHRCVPDVSFDADPVSGVAIYCTSSTPYETNWLPAGGGTSLGALCWAAINSLNRTASNSRIYPIDKSVYKSASIRDITNGTNGKYNATTAYDFCTGLGSPLTRAFVSLLQGDVKLDGKVDVFDAILLTDAFLSVPGNGNWNSFADINMDNVVDIYDAILLSNHWGQNYSGGTGSGMLGGTLDKPATLSGGASVLVNPSQSTVFKGEVFTVNVDVTNVTDLQGWEFKFYWNSTVLNCTNVVVQVPAEWQNNSQTYGPGLEPSYNATHARYWQAEVGAYPAASFNGSTTFATFTFQAMQPGTTSLSLVDVNLGNSTGEPLDYSASDGSVTVYNGRYMRSDTQQVNGLSVYKLSIPQSTSSVMNTQSGTGDGALWGIRAWVRHSNGVEQEISLDGQTGTPMATVDGGSAGIRSSTVSAAQTALQSTDSLVVRVYLQIGNGPWSLCATFTTEQLQSSLLKGTVWTVYYYTSSSYNARLDRTTAKFYWGTITYNSRIQNLQFS